MSDNADRAQAQAEWLEQFRVRHVRKHVQRLSDACADCGDLIPAARLTAEPTATRCIDCQTRHERTR